MLRGRALQRLALPGAPGRRRCQEAPGAGGALGPHPATMCNEAWTDLVSEAEASLAQLSQQVEVRCRRSGALGVTGDAARASSSASTRVQERCRHYSRAIQVLEDRMHAKSCRTLGVAGPASTQPFTCSRPSSPLVCANPHQTAKDQTLNKSKDDVPCAFRSSAFMQDLIYAPTHRSPLSLSRYNARLSRLEQENAELRDIMYKHAV